MNRINVLLLLLTSCCVFNESQSAIRGNARNEALQNAAREISLHARSLAVSQPPVTAAAVSPAGPPPTPLPPGVLIASSHMVQWGSALNGCSYTLPAVTVSCGTGGTIAMGQKNSEARGCIKRGTNTLICTSVPSPKSNPQVTVTCFGRTNAQLTLVMRIPATQARCSSLITTSFPLNQAIYRGGAASVLTFLARYCKDSQNKLYLNTNYTCGSGAKRLNQGSISFCSFDKGCSVRLRCNSTNPDKDCPGSCLSTLVAVATSDPEVRSSCVNVGPRPTRLPASLHGLTWSNFHPRCSLAANVVGATCGSGGTIVIASKGSSVTDCSLISTSSLRCTKNATVNAGAVSFYCYGTTPTALTATAFLPSRNATNCTNAPGSVVNIATQSLLLQRFCGNGTLTGLTSQSCGDPSQLLITEPSKVPICVASNQCRSNSSSSGCLIPLDAVSISDASDDPTCIVNGPQSLFF